MNGMAHKSSGMKPAGSAVVLRRKISFLAFAVIFSVSAAVRPADAACLPRDPGLTEGISASAHASGQVAQTSQLRTEQQLLAVLKSDASLKEKDAAFAELKRVATAVSVPILAGLLTSPEFSHSARYVLESLPAPEAGRTLIAALGRTNGLIKAGIIDSLGRRRESGAVGPLAVLLRDLDLDIVRSSAAALGRIGGAKAFEAVFTALKDHDASDGKSTLPEVQIAAQRAAYLDALLTMANRMLEQGDQLSARMAFERIKRFPMPDHGRLAWALGGLTAEPGEYWKLNGVKAGILGSDRAVQTAALETARSDKSPGMTNLLCGLLTRVPSPIQASLIEALRQRGDPAAASAILPMAMNTDPAVRIAAIGALGDLGDEKAVPVLLASARSTDDVESRAARQALLDIRRGPIGDALISSLRTGDAAAQAEATRALAGRGDAKIIPDLISVARDGSGNARAQALIALGKLARPSDIKEMVALVTGAPDDDARGQAGEALRSACERLDDWGIGVDAGPVVSALAASGKPARAALLQASTALRDERIREALRSALADPDASLRDGAFSALCETRDPELVPDLGRLAAQAQDQNQRIKAVRGYVRVASNAAGSLIPTAQRVAALELVVPLITRPDEKWLLLAGLAKMPDPGALALALPMIDDTATKSEAAGAATTIAASLPASEAPAARAALNKVLARVADPALRQAAADALRKIDEASGDAPAISFRRVQIDAAFRSEGVAVADFDRDGRLDIATGNILYLGPDWRPRPMLAAAKAYRPEEYSNEFLCFDEDLDRDGWIDLIVVGFPGAKTRWLRNPGKAGGPWPEFLAVERTGNESPDWLDADKDGRKELVFVSEKGMAFARPGKDPTKPWPIQVIASPADPRPAHGLGVGDINGDGRADVLCAEGWWEGPAHPTKRWTFHKAKLGYEAAAQLVALDVDGDGNADVASSAAHRYGMWWHEQTPAGWVPHDIDMTMSQLHALHAADIDGDGKPELVTGKRFWAHREGDEGIDDPAILCWFEIKRDGGRVSWVRHDIDYDSGVGLHFRIVDIDGDGLPDIVTSNKKGVYVFMQERK